MTKPYDDEYCHCHTITKEIDEKFPNANWNCDEACKEWHEREEELEFNDIEYEEGSDANYCCNCPACGRTICGWCL
jgi:hypothetical protein